MNLDEQFPTATPDFQTDDGFLKTQIVYECAACKKKTAWFHMSSTTPFCSRDCYAQYCRERFSRRKQS